MKNVKKASGQQLKVGNTRVTVRRDNTQRMKDSSKPEPTKAQMMPSIAQGFMKTKFLKSEDANMKMTGLNKKSMQMIAGTQAGRDFICSAINPAGSEIRASWTDGENVRGGILSFTEGFTIGRLDSGAITGSTPWSADLALLPNPIIPLFCVARATDSGGSGQAREWNKFNPQIAPIDNNGDIYTQRYRGWCKNVERWRCCGMSVTVETSEPATEAPGFVTANQYPVAPHMFNICVPQIDAAGQVERMFASSHITCFQEDDYPSEEALLLDPLSYHALANEGVYVPLRLGHKGQAWHDYTETTMVGDFLGHVEVENPGCLLSDAPASGGQVGFYPYVDVPRAYWTANSPASTKAVTLPSYQAGKGAPPSSALSVDAATASVFGGGITSPFCNDYFGLVTFSGLPATAYLRVKVVHHWQIQVQPSSIYLPMCASMPATIDELAIENYFRLARRLAVAYPASYNDWGTIWKAISSVAKTVLPFASFIPGIGPVVSAVGGAIVNAVDSATLGAGASS